MLPDNIQIIVIATKHRKPLITAYLYEPFTLSLTPDYELPATREWQYDYLNRNPLGAYRCFRAHQNAVSKANAAYSLIIEDDAVALSGWEAVVIKALPYLNSYDVVSLHARNIQKPKRIDDFIVEAQNTRTNIGNVVYNGKWAMGSLAYLVGTKGRQAIAAAAYDGLPMDLYLANRLALAIVEPSPFQHDRNSLSIVETAK